MPDALRTPADVAAMFGSTERALTDPQRRALEYLASVNSATPSELGQGIGGTRSGKAQGLGRLGGAMAHRLIKMNLAVDVSRFRGGFPSYAISREGRAAIGRPE